MALRALMLRKNLDTKKKELEELNARAKELEAKESELEKAIEETETEEERSAVEEEVAEYYRSCEDLKKLKNDLERVIGDIEEKLEKEEEEEPAEEEEEKEPEGRGAEKMNEVRNTNEIEVRAFNNYIRTGETRGDDYNMQKGNNGDIIPKTISQNIVTKVSDLCPIWEKATKYNVKGTLEIPFYPASSDHVIAAAFASEFAELDGSVGDFDSVTLTGYLAGARALISKSLINNTDIPVESFIVEQMAKAFASFYEDKCLNGGTLSGSTTVTGVLAGVTQTVTATYKSSVTSDDLIELQMAIKQAYQNNCAWIMAPATLKAIRKLKDDEGRYILNPDVRSGFGYELLGKPVYLSDHMPALGTTNNKAILYGDLSCVAIKTVEDLEINVLREKYIEKHCIGVQGWTEFDCKVANAQGLAVLKCGSSDPQ